MIPNSFPLVLWAMLCVFQLGKAQIDYNPETNTLFCSKIGGHYCLEGSLQGSILLSCVSETVVEIRACDIQLLKILPKGYNNTATCYESSIGNGDALCAFNGTGYTLDGEHVKIPETAICHDLIPPEPEDEANSHDTTATHILAFGTTTLLPSLAEHQSSPTASRTKTNVTVCSNPWPACTTCTSTRQTTTIPTTSTLINLPTDPSGRPYSVVSEIMSAGPESGPGQGTSSKGVVLVEPSSPVTGTTGADNGSSSAGPTAFGGLGLVSVVVAGMVWFVVLGGGLG